MATVKRSKEHDGKETVAFEVTSPIRLGQLEVELQEALERDDLSLSVEGSPDASTDAPALLFVAQGENKISEIQSVISEHEPQEGWRPNPGEPQVADVVRKATSGEDLDAGEIQIALRYLLGLSSG